MKIPIVEVVERAEKTIRMVMMSDIATDRFQ
jgi:hypothetical protein